MANYYNPYGYQNYINPYQQNYQQPVQQVQQIHNGGLVNVRSEQEARNYPVAPATSVTFHNENEPYIYTKTVGSSLEAPRFEKFKLVREETEGKQEEPTNVVEYVQKTEFEALRADFEELSDKYEELSDKINRKEKRNVQSKSSNANAPTV